MRAFYICVLVITSACIAQMPSLAAGPEVWNTECFHISGGKIKVKAPCTVKVYARSTSASEEWEWSNGNRTSVKMSQKGIFINNQKAEERDASEITGVKAYCYWVKPTNDTFCWAKNSTPQ